MTVLRRLALVTALLVTGCASPGGTVGEQRTAANDMRQRVLADLYRQKASARAEIAAAPGYAVFSNANVNVIVASFGGGYGVLRDNASGADTFMRMGEAGLGLGAGVKDYRVVFVFHDRATMQDFVESGWSFGAQADAAAKASDKGAAIGAEVLADDVSVYQLTANGLALQATLKGTRYWRDAALNQTR